MVFIASDREPKPSRGRDAPSGLAPTQPQLGAVWPTNPTPKRNWLLTIASNPVSKYILDPESPFGFQLAPPVVPLSRRHHLLPAQL